MSQRIKKNIIYLQLLLNTHRSQQKALLNSISVDQFSSISEIALNILEGVVPISSTQKKALSRHKKFIRLIGQEKGSYSRKKSLLLKNVTALTVLLKTITPLLKSL